MVHIGGSVSRRDVSFKNDDKTRLRTFLNAALPGCGGTVRRRTESPHSRDVLRLLIEARFRGDDPAGSSQSCLKPHFLSWLYLEPGSTTRPRFRRRRISPQETSDWALSYEASTSIFLPAILRRRIFAALSSSADSVFASTPAADAYGFLEIVPSFCAGVASLLISVRLRGFREYCALYYFSAMPIDVAGRIVIQKAVLIDMHTRVTAGHLISATARGFISMFAFSRSASCITPSCGSGQAPTAVPRFPKYDRIGSNIPTPSRPWADPRSF